MSAKGKNKALMVVNSVLFLLLIIQAVSAVLFVIGWAGSWTYRVHTVGGFLMILAAMAHITLNFGWIKAQFAGKGNRS